LIEFIFMLTQHDATVGNALEVYEELRGTGLKYIGFKDIGVPLEVLGEVRDKAHDDGLEVMLEVVSTSREDELRSLGAGALIQVDWILGGTHPVEGTAVLGEDFPGKYCPFPGRVVGHPSVLEGEISEIADSAREITALDGVTGLDLLAYRHATADIGELTRAVVEASAGPVIAAGSVASLEQIKVLEAAGAWGFTIGSAIFEGKLPGGPSLAGQVREVLRASS
jgi:hypothetical protein